MIIRDVINFTGGTQISLTGREYLAPNGSDTLIVILPCEDLRGPADGSQLNKMEQIDWWPKFARNTDYPFNIFAVQVSGGYHFLLGNLIPAMKNRYNPKNIVLLGCGLGGFAAYNVLSETTDPAVKLVITISGGSDRTGSISNWHIVKGQAWHGTIDPRFSIAAHKDAVKKYNDTHGQRIDFNELQGVGYEAWKHAFNPNPANDPAFQFVKTQLNLGQATPPADNCDEIRQQLAAVTAQRDELQNIIIAAYNETN